MASTMTCTECGRIASQPEIIEYDMCLLCEVKRLLAQANTRTHYEKESQAIQVALFILNQATKEK